MTILIAFLIAFLVFALAVLLMSLGVLLNGRRIQGSCGGLGNIPGLESDCGGLCRTKSGKPGQACPRRSRSGADPGHAEPGSPRPWTSNGNTR